MQCKCRLPLSDGVDAIMLLSDGYRDLMSSKDGGLPCNAGWCGWCYWWKLTISSPWYWENKGTISLQARLICSGAPSTSVRSFGAAKWPNWHNLQRMDLCLMKMALSFYLYLSLISVCATGINPVNQYRPCHFQWKLAHRWCDLLSWGGTGLLTTPEETIILFPSNHTPEKLHFYRFIPSIHSPSLLRISAYGLILPGNIRTSSFLLLKLSKSRPLQRTEF